MKSQLNLPRGKRDDPDQFRLSIEKDAREKRAIFGRVRAEISVFGTTLSPAIGACRGCAAEAERPEPTKSPNRSLVAHIIIYMS